VPQQIGNILRPLLLVQDNVRRALVIALATLRAPGSTSVVVSQTHHLYECTPAVAAAAAYLMSNCESILSLAETLEKGRKKAGLAHAGAAVSSQNSATPLSVAATASVSTLTSNVYLCSASLRVNCKEMQSCFPTAPG
jgi:hypothetical protein